MLQRAIALLVLLATFTALASARTESWIEVRTPHFTVLTNASEKQGRRVADQFERMRAVFHNRFPTARLDSASPMVVLAVRDKRDFESLEPEAYLAKGQLNIAGLFLRTEDRNYILLRLDVEGDHPYETVYHEYTHFITSRAQEWMPLWLTEGLAEFYQTTEIENKEVGLGRPSVENIALLRQNRLLPLATLLNVDQSSPYYHEENKGSIFYAESWALTHYLEIKDLQNHTRHMTEYGRLIMNKVDSVTAATQAFGDLKVLERNLQHYIEQGSFLYIRVPGATEVDSSTYKVIPTSLTDTDAIRADIMALNNRVKDSRALLARVLQQDPNNVLARETMGHIAFREGKLKEAQDWYEQAVKLDSQSYLAHYYFAVITMQAGLSNEHLAQIESSLRQSIKLNPDFAPAFDELARFYAMQRKNLDEARTLNLRAVELEPSNLGYRQNAANLLMLADRIDDALRVLEVASKLATTPDQVFAITSQMESIQRYKDERVRYEREAREYREQTDSSRAVTIEVTAPEPNPTLEHHGPRRTARGTLKEVRCSSPATMTLTLTGGPKPIELRSRNYYKIEYTALGFTPKGELHPCSDLDGMKAKVTYFEGATPTEGQIIAIEMNK